MAEILNIKKITAITRTDFRSWLVKNHNKETKVSVVLYKKHTSKQSPSHRELMEEAICFGWIDTTVKRLDDAKYIRNFSKRNKNSKWSDNTLRCGKELIKQGKMTPVGLKFYKEGLKKPTHDAGIPKNPNMPVELERALNNDKKAKEKFEKFPPSIKRIIYRLILSGKQEETRTRRINLTVKNARIGKSF